MSLNDGVGLSGKKSYGKIESVTRILCQHAHNMQVSLSGMDYTCRSFFHTLITQVIIVLIFFFFSFLGKFYLFLISYPLHNAIYLFFHSGMFPINQLILPRWPSSFQKKIIIIIKERKKSLKMLINNN